MSQDLNKNEISQVCLSLSLRSSWHYNEFEKEFGISIEEASHFTDLFCICDHQTHVYENAPFEEIRRFSHYSLTKATLYPLSNRGFFLNKIFYIEVR